MKYSIGTLVTDYNQYNEMKESFLKKGFKEENCEFLVVDNTNGTNMDAFKGNNWVLDKAKSEYVILCHQDIRLDFDSIKTLDTKLKSLTEKHSDWGLAGNAGGISPGKLALRITDPFGFNQNVGGPFPVKTQTLDGNFIVVRKDTGLKFSEDLSGFHFYDADICMLAEQKGYGVYVIDFHLRHLGQGNTDAVFEQSKQQFRKKWKNSGKTIQLTTGPVTL